MDKAVRRYVVRVLTFHLALLAGVLLVVGLAGRALYNSAQAEAEAQALTRLTSSAGQAATALERHVGGLFDTLSLRRRTVQARLLARGGREGRYVADSLWAQTRNRLSDLIVVDVTQGEELATAGLAVREQEGNTPPTADPREATEAGGSTPAGSPAFTAAEQMAMFVSPDLYRVLPEPPDARRLVDQAGAWLRQVALAREPALSGPYRVSVPADDVSGEARSVPVLLLAVPLMPAAAPTTAAATAGEDARGGPDAPRRARFVEAAPDGDDSPGEGRVTLVVGVLPTDYLDANFLVPAGEPGLQGLVLFDAGGALVAGGGDADVNALVGRDVRELAPGTVSDGLAAYVARTVAGDVDPKRDFGPIKLGDLDYARTIVVARPLRSGLRPPAPAAGVTAAGAGVASAAAAAGTAAAAASVAGTDRPPTARSPSQGRFWLFAVLDHDSVVGPLEQVSRTATLWAAALVVAMTTILVSSAVQLIRGRNRLERLRTQMIDKELDDARRIQLLWLPDDEVRETETRHIEIAAENVPASHISGDFYNYFDLPDGRCALVIGDVTGHGMAAAFLMATTQLLIKTTLQRIGDPGKTLEEVNDLLCTQAFGGQFVTIQLIVVDTNTDTLQVASAGHPAPLTCEPGGRWHPLGIDAQLVLGVMEGSEYPTQTLAAPRCDSLLLFTDGVVEAKNKLDERFSEEQLAEWLERRIGSNVKSAKHLAEETLSIVRDFTGGVALEDDLTLLAVHLTPARRRQEGSHSSDRPTTAEVIADA